jgi:hypothetical protein
MRKRNILLVEPGYKTKFPPLGLMKISSYHKEIGDEVHFVKGIQSVQNSLWDKIKDTYWERIYISTLFTFNWKETVETIKWYKWLAKDIGKVRIGGVLATLMPDELWKETGIYPLSSLLDKPGVLGDDNDLIVDDMIPDYSLFDNYPHNYALLDSYIGYSTRGCKRACAFCGVRKLEPKFLDYVDIKSYVKRIDDEHGPKKNLILLDNNILASTKLKKIVQDIKDLGFERTSNGNQRPGYVDFNQGVDARLIIKKRKEFRLLSDIPINPLRIAFDNIQFENTYRESISLAADCGIKKLSNYILYNFNDSPEDFWRRLKINIDLNEKLDLHIYSFPMKYIPLDAKDRSFISEPKWNWQFLRGVQRILHVMHGAVMYKKDFFLRAFGETEADFVKILHMPEKLLMNRGRDQKGEEVQWRLKFDKLTENERRELLNILCNSRKKASLKKSITFTKNKKVKDILNLYLPDTDSESMELELENEIYEH